jgi:hypothetical protein
MTRRLCVLVLTAGLASASAAPKIFYSKDFPGSDPAYVEVTVDQDGRAEYKEAAGDERPVRFQLSPAETSEVFGLAAKLNNFVRPLESNLKVAKTGTKTFRYEDGAEKHEVKFNYSLDNDAKLLGDWFERIVETERHLVSLERAAKFDKLGVNKALLELEISRDRKRLVAPEQFLTILDRIAKNESYLHMARARAAGLAEDFRKTTAQ